MNEIQTLNNLVTEIKFFETQAVVSYWEIGKRLAQAKEQVGHGNWLEWVDRNLGYSERNTQRLIQVYKSYSNPTTVSHLGFRQLELLAPLEEETRAEIIENENLEDKTVKETQEIIKKYKEKAEDLEEENQGLKLANQELTNIIDKQETKVIEKEVIKEVKPSDYESLKRRVQEYEDELNNQREINRKLKQKEKEIISQLSEEKAKEKIVNDIESFAWTIDGFIKNVGGLVYLAEYSDELPNFSKELFEKAIYRLNDWSNLLKQNYERMK